MEIKLVYLIITVMGTRFGCENFTVPMIQEILSEVTAYVLQMMGVII